MSASILVGYATKYGSTQEVAETIAATIHESGSGVDLKLAREVRTLTGYSAVILGAPLFMFHWHKEALHFLSNQRKGLVERPIAIFALGPTHEPHDAQEWQDSWTQLNKELAKFSWLAPFAVEMFGGKYDPEKLRFPIKQLAGETPASDLRDWTAIRSWAVRLTAYLGSVQPSIS